MKKFNELRKKYPVFIYHRFDLMHSDAALEIQFEFSMPPGITFRPSIKIPRKKFAYKIDLDHSVLQNIAFHIGMIELISYWKCACSPTVLIKAGTLSGSQIQWWKKLYF